MFKREEYRQNKHQRKQAINEDRNMNDNYHKSLIVNTSIDKYPELELWKNLKYNNNDDDHNNNDNNNNNNDNNKNVDDNNNNNTFLDDFYVYLLYFFFAYFF